MPSVTHWSVTVISEAKLKPGRNEACPCGSGRKFKHCCGVALAASIARDNLSLLEIDNLVALVSQGRLGDAENRARKLLVTHPNHGMLCKILSVVLVRQHKEALEALRHAARLLPNDAEAHANLGADLHDRGEWVDAVPSLRRALHLRPNDVDAYHNLGRVLIALGDYAGASECYQRVLTLSPLDVDALNSLGTVVRCIGRRREAIPLYQRAIEIDPQRVDSYWNLGTVLFELRRIDEAMAHYLHALNLNPNYAPAHLSMGLALRQQRRPLEALISCNAALRIDPDYVEALSLLGELQADSGHFEEADALFRRAIAIKPDFSFAYFSIATHRKMTKEDVSWCEAVNSLLATPIPLSNEIHLRYALGKYFDDIQEYDSAFENYRQANDLTQRYGLSFDPQKLTKTIDHTLQGFSREFINRSATNASGSELPVFVVGMPRSGTSLIEQILASHPAVFGAGELPYWENVFRAYRKTQLTGEIDCEFLRRATTDYINLLTTSSGQALRVVDKMPANFLYAGLIHSIFPQARIIHIQRHPIDTCLSIYFQNFFGMGPYSNNLENLAHYYAEYIRITDHWRSILPASSWLEVPYEELVTQQEPWSRRMVEFMGLPWDARCLDFHRTQRVVITASKWQVRQKVHSASIGRWRHYEQYLGPLLRLVN